MVEPGLIDFVDPHDSAAAAKRVQFGVDEVAFRDVAPGEAKGDNRLVNVGERPHRALVVELKPESPGGYGLVPRLKPR